jgi:hypothetical protein
MCKCSEESSPSPQANDYGLDFIAEFDEKTRQPFLYKAAGYAIINAFKKTRRRKYR